MAGLRQRHGQLLSAAEAICDGNNEYDREFERALDAPTGDLLIPDRVWFDKAYRGFGLGPIKIAEWWESIGIRPVPQRTPALGQEYRGERGCIPPAGRGGGGRGGGEWGEPRPRG
ncbi:hypothetical protein ACFXA3_22285, partial [Streptomyces sp. NPDC059456]